LDRLYSCHMPDDCDLPKKFFQHFNFVGFRHVSDPDKEFQTIRRIKYADPDPVKWPKFSEGKKT
jgi:hypothetical protein